MAGIRFRNTLLGLTALLAVLTVDSAAQNQKIGYVDTDYILSQIPEYQGIEQQLRMRGQEWKKELDRMQEEIDRLKEEYEAREILYTEEVQKQKQSEIQQKIREREQYREQKFGADGEYYQKQKELLQPVQRRVLEAIDKIARRDNYDFVFDQAGNTDMLFSLPEWNLNEEVLVEMGIDTNEISN